MKVYVVHYNNDIESYGIMAIYDDLDTLIKEIKNFYDGEVPIDIISVYETETNKIFEDIMYLKKLKINWRKVSLE